METIELIVMKLSCKIKCNYQAKRAGYMMIYIHNVKILLKFIQFLSKLSE